MTALEDALAWLDKYKAAEAAILLGKEVRLTSAGGIDRVVRLEDLSYVRAGRQEWERKVAQLQAGALAPPTFGGLGYSVARFDQGTGGSGRFNRN